MPPDIKDSFKVGSKTVVVHDCDLRGDITIGSGTILQPRCTIVAAAGPIIFGSNNIVEETAVIVNRLKQPMIIGDNNLFEVGCRIEAPSIGSDNTFGIRSRVSSAVSVASNCVVGAGCVVLPSPFASAKAKSGTAQEAIGDDVSMASASAEPEAATAAPPTPDTQSTPPHGTLADYTHVFGAENRRRTATSEGSGQAKALFVKHWEYLRETLPKYHKLKMF
ncbi:dynactin subunit 6 [Rhodotorula paludigena]|uniref:dynactin subunit 6 n=1 Tax=Rhodotorula paludigena TaxID=86838 RepID=UPI00317E23D8